MSLVLPADELSRARLRALLWEMPILSNTDIPVVLDISQRTWERMKQEEHPPLFRVSNRIYVRTSALVEWLASRELANEPPADPTQALHDLLLDS